MKSVIIMLAIALIVGADIDKTIKRETVLIQLPEQPAIKENTPEADKYKHLKQVIQRKSNS